MCELSLLLPSLLPCVPPVIPVRCPGRARPPRVNKEMFELAVCTVGDAKPPAEETIVDRDKPSASTGGLRPSEKPLLSVTANQSLTANEHINIASLKPHEVIAVAVCVPWLSTRRTVSLWVDSLPALPLLQDMRHRSSREFMFVRSIGACVLIGTKSAHLRLIP
jgi:hypothetical protein